jgi:hypothetical protein
MTDDTFRPPAGRRRYIRGDWSFMLDGSNDEDQPEDSDDDEDESSDG